MTEVKRSEGCDSHTFEAEPNREVLDWLGRFAEYTTPVIKELLDYSEDRLQGGVFFPDG